MTPEPRQPQTPGDADIDGECARLRELLVERDDDVARLFAALHENEKSFDAWTSPSSDRLALAGPAVFYRKELWDSLLSPDKTRAAIAENLVWKLAAFGRESYGSTEELDELMTMLHEIFNLRMRGTRTLNDFVWKRLQCAALKAAVALELSPDDAKVPYWDENGMIHFSE